MERLKEARSQHPRAPSGPSSYRWPSGAGGLPGILAPQLALADPPRQKPCSPQRGHRRGPGQHPPRGSGSGRARLPAPSPRPRPAAAAPAPRDQRTPAPGPTPPRPLRASCAPSATPASATTSPRDLRPSAPRPHPLAPLGTAFVFLRLRGPSSVTPECPPLPSGPHLTPVRAPPCPAQSQQERPRPVP